MPAFQPPFLPSGPAPFGTPGGVSGGQPLALPLVSTVGVNGVTATSASLVGSINGQGLSGSWWFTYGTTPQYGSTTTVTALPASVLPQTFTATISGLTTGGSYWFAMVGQTAAGTVTSAPLQFVAATPQPVPTTSSIPTRVGTAQPAIPHYRFPIQFTAANGIGVVQQDTLDEVFSNVQAVAACIAGACPELPTFGIPELTFGQAPLNPRPLIAAIKQWEPRATEAAVSQAVGDANAGVWGIALTTGVIGSGQ